MRQATGRRARGFTLIETLLTLSMFTLLMSALLTGLFAGTRAWSKADAHLVRSSRVEQALSAFAWDLERLHFDIKWEEPVFQVGKDDQQRDVIALWTLEEAPGRPATGGVSEAHWRVEDTGEGKQWVRVSRRHVGGVAIGDPVEKTILTGIREIEFLFYDGRDWVEAWEGRQELPVAIQARASLRGAPAVERWMVARPSGGPIQ